MVVCLWDAIENRERLAVKGSLRTTTDRKQGEGRGGGGALASQRETVARQVRG